LSAVENEEESRIMKISVMTQSSWDLSKSNVDKQRSAPTFYSPSPPSRTHPPGTGRVCTPFRPSPATLENDDEEEHIPPQRWRGEGVGGGGVRTANGDCVSLPSVGNERSFFFLGGRSFTQNTSKHQQQNRFDHRPLLGGVPTLPLTVIMI
jgi:hypothetical protein